MAVATYVRTPIPGLEGARGVLIHSFDDEDGSATPFTRNVRVPDWASEAIFYLNWTVEGGTTGLVDLAINDVDPVDQETVTALEGWDGITQLSAVDLVTIRIGPGYASTTVDDTGVDYHIGTSLPAILQTVLTLSIADANETYDLTLSVVFR